jgi:hypothetical protein
VALEEISKPKYTLCSFDEHHAKLKPEPDSKGRDSDSKLHYRIVCPKFIYVHKQTSLLKFGYRIFSLGVDRSMTKVKCNMRPLHTEIVAAFHVQAN